MIYTANQNGIFSVSSTQMEQDSSYFIIKKNIPDGVWMDKDQTDNQYQIYVNPKIDGISSVSLNQKIFGLI